MCFKENCLAGCPCNDFECSTTTISDVTTPIIPATTTAPAGNAVLVLSTSYFNNRPMIIDFEGRRTTTAYLNDVRKMKVNLF